MRDLTTDSYRRMRACLSGLLDSQPFFGSMALSLPLKADFKRRTLASDGETIWFNPAWVSMTQADDIRTAMARVVLACALKHHTRRGERQYKRWQRASQMVTLPLLRDAGLTEEGGGIEDKGVEDVYTTLPDEPDDEGEKGAGDNDEEGPGSGSSGPPSDGGGQGKGNGQGEGGEGSNPSSQDPGGKGEVMDAPTPPDSTESEKASARQDSEQEWDEKAHQSSQYSKAQGNQPGEIQQRLEAAHHQQISWREILRRFMTAASKSDYSWSRPNRRFIDSGLYLPSLYSEGMPPIVFAVDTSGSIDEVTLTEVWGEIRSACEEVMPEFVTIIQCDAQIQHVERYDPHDLPPRYCREGKRRHGLQARV